MAKDAKLAGYRSWKEKYQALEQQSEQTLAAYETILSRGTLRQALGKQFDTQRDVWKTLGYDDTITTNKYWEAYHRADLAGRIVDLPAVATWRRRPEVKENENPNEQTDFEAEFERLADRLNLWWSLERADRISGIGRYGVLLIGSTKKDLKQPLGQFDGPEDVLWVEPYWEGDVEVHQIDGDHTSRTFRQPLTYKINLTPEITTTNRIKEPERNETGTVVHASRVIHIAEALHSNKVHGIPRLRRVWNLLDDLLKAVGGTAESFWKVADRGIHADVRDPEANLDQDDLDNLGTRLDEYVHNMRRFIQTSGVDIKSIGSDAPDPSGIFNSIISLISGTTGIPKRILLGSEEGELASSQDENNWNSRIQERQSDFATPVILRPLIDRLVEHGALPRPEKVMVEWPDLLQVGGLEQSRVAQRKSSAVINYHRAQASAIEAGSEIAVSESEFRSDFLGLPAQKQTTAQDGMSANQKPLNNSDIEHIRAKRHIRWQPPARRSG